MSVFDRLRLTSPEWHWDYQHNPLEREGNKRDEFILWMSVFDRLRLTKIFDRLRLTSPESKIFQKHKDAKLVSPSGINLGIIKNKQGQLNNNCPWIGFYEA